MPVLWIIAMALFLGCTPKKPAQKLVVLTFDDAVRSHLEYVAPMLKEKGFGGTFFVCDLWMRDTVNFLQWDEVGELHQMGFEIANHTWDHGHLTQEEAFIAMEENLGKVDSALLANGVPGQFPLDTPETCSHPVLLRRSGSWVTNMPGGGCNPRSPMERLPMDPSMILK